MLEKLESKMDNVHESVLSVNAKMKKALEETRQGDKLCCDMLCIMLLVGMIIVLVKLSQNNSKKKK